MNDTVSLRIQLIYTIRILYNSIGEAKSNQSRPSDNFFSICIQIRTKLTWHKPF